MTFPLGPLRYQNITILVTNVAGPPKSPTLMIVIIIAANGLSTVLSHQRSSESVDKAKTKPLQSG